MKNEKTERTNQNAVALKKYLENRQENTPVKKNEDGDIKLSKPLIKLMHKISETSIPRPDMGIEEEKVPRDEYIFYNEPIGITIDSKDNIIALENVTELSAYDHTLIDKGFTSNYGIYKVFDLIIDGSISEKVLEEYIRSNINVFEHAFSGYIVNILLDLISAYMSKLIEAIKKDFQGENLYFLDTMFNEISIVPLKYGRGSSRMSNNTFFMSIYTYLISIFELREAYNQSRGVRGAAAISTDKEKNDAYIIFNNKVLNEVPTRLVLTIYDNIHIQLCTNIGVISYEVISDIMNNYVNPNLTSLHGAIRATLRELISKLIPIFEDYPVLTEYIDTIYQRYDSYYDDNEF